MGLAGVQKALALLCTQPGLRARFCENPAAVAVQMGLSREELSALRPEEVSFFSASLFHKRLREVSKLLPWTRAALNGELDPLFRRHAERYHPCGAGKHRDDALRFVEFLRKESSLPDWILELARYEGGWLRAASGRVRLQIQLYRYSVREIARTALCGSELAAPARTLRLAIWVRGPGPSRLRHFFF